MTLLGSILQDAEYQTCKSGPTQYFTWGFNFKHMTSPINYKKIAHVLKDQARVLSLSGLDSLASYKTKPWGLDPINPFSHDYQRTPRIAHINIQNRCNELDKIYSFPMTLCPVLASKLFLCFTKILSPILPILFQVGVQAIWRKVWGGLPAKMFKFNYNFTATPPLAWELMICTLGETNLPGSTISPCTIPWRFPRGSHTPSSWQALRELLEQPTPRAPHTNLGSTESLFQTHLFSHPWLTCTPLFLRLNLFISEIHNPDGFLQRC